MEPYIWWQSTAQWKRIATIAGAIVAVIAAITAIANVLALGEPHWIATRGFARGTAYDTKQEITNQIKSSDIQQNAQLVSLHRRMIESELSRVRDKRFEINERISNHRLVLTQNRDIPDTVRDIINRQIALLADEVVSTERRIDALERELLSQRP